MARKLKRPLKDVKLPNVWQLTKAPARLLWRHRKLFLGITVVYGLLNLILVQGLANGNDVSVLKEQLNDVFTGNLGGLVSSLGVFVVLVGSAGNGSSEVAGAYQLFLALITSLAVIWALREVLAGRDIGVREAYYRGMFPLIPVILVLLMVGLQLLPFMIGSGVYGTVVSGGIAVGSLEKLLFLAGFIGLAALSLYWVTSSLFALYIVMLPDMTPMKALRSARALVKGRRLMVLRKLLWLPLVLVVAAAAIMLPIILWLTPLAQWVFFVLTMFGLVAVHAYMYNLYRELLNE